MCLDAYQIAKHQMNGISHSANHQVFYIDEIKSCTVLAADSVNSRFSSIEITDNHFYPTIDINVFILVVGAFRSPKSMYRT